MNCHSFVSTSTCSTFSLLLPESPLLADGTDIILIYSGFLGFGIVICVLITGKFLWAYSLGLRHCPAAETKWSLQTRVLEFNGKFSFQFYGSILLTMLCSSSPNQLCIPVRLIWAPWYGTKVNHITEKQTLNNVLPLYHIYLRSNYSL